MPCTTSKSAFTVFSCTTFIHFWQQHQWPWRALSALQKKKKNHSSKCSHSDAAVSFQSSDFCSIWTSNMCWSSSSDTHLKHKCSVFLGYFSAGTSYKWCLNTKCRKKETWEYVMLLRIRCRPRARECVSVMAAVRCLQRRQQGKRGPQHSPHTEQMERRDTSDLLSCAPLFHHVISASCLQLGLPPCLSHGEYCKAWRETANLSRAKRRPLDRVHPWRRPIMSHVLVAWGQLPRLSVCLTWQELGCVFAMSGFPWVRLVRHGIWPECQSHASRQGLCRPPLCAYMYG